VSNREKMLIWAHNDHIAHTKIGGSYRMGYFLREQLKEQYYALSFVFDEGFVRAYDPSNNELKTFFYPSSTFSGSIEASLKNAGSPFYFLNVLEIKDPTIIDFFEQNKYQKNIGHAYSSNQNKIFLKLPVMECFDGLIFIRKTNAAVTLNMNE
jgi:erythromycin esterase